VPLRATGARSEHLVAFAREHDWRMAVTLVPRLPYSLHGGELSPKESPWGDTQIALPSNAPSVFFNVMTGESVQPAGRMLSCREVFVHFPVALLIG